MKHVPRSDSSLQLSRRLDWRFLLPEPRLQRVALFDAPQSLLARALQHFSEELAIFENADYARATDFDIVVLARPSLTLLTPAMKLLVPGGHLYAEVQHAWRWRDEHKLPTHALRLPKIVDWQAELSRLGFAQIEAHWHRPTFEQAVQIIPLDDASAMDFVFKRRSEDLISQLKFATGRSLMNQAWLARLLQCVSLVARKPE